MEIKLSELLEILGNKQEQPQPVNERKIGFRIVVLDRGFVHSGTVFDCGETYRIEGCKNIRVWGTTKGLGELVDGPLKDTKLDVIGTVEVQKRATLFLIQCNREF